LWRRLPFRQARERAYVGYRAATQGHRRVVTTILPFQANALSKPPDRRVVEEHGFHSRLEQVHEGIETPNVR
jgi:hypothetical protein